MNFSSKISWIAFTIILFSISFLNINDLISFDGDELGTLDLQKIHKPIPYKIIVSFILGLFNKVPENILLIRFSSLLFSLVAILIWYKYLLKSRKEIIIFNLLFLTNSFILRESSYFRYYSFYFLTSSFFLAYAVEISKEFNSNVKLLISIIITFFSPFVFFVINLIQYLFFLFNIIVYEIVEKTRLRTLFYHQFNIITYYFNNLSEYSLVCTRYFKLIRYSYKFKFKSS